VNSETLFGAMSTTKAMTSVAMGILVDEGKVNWNDKVSKYLPDFRIADPYVTNELKVRDLFTHNAGLGNADFIWAWTPELSPAEIARRMQYAPQAYSFRGGYTYQNIMYMVAGLVIEKVSGMSWERFVTERIFVPLGMKNTFPTLASSRRYSNLSSAHYEIDEKVQVIPEMAVDTAAAAGSVWSTSDDIAKWMNFNLGNTTVNGKEILKPATLAEIMRPQIVVPPGQFYPTVALSKPHWTTYSLGWFQQDYRGDMVQMHTGSLAGRTAIVGLIPDKKLGIYIFGNVDHVEVRHALMFKAFDVFAHGDNGRDWSTEAKALYDAADANAERQQNAMRALRAANTTPSLPLSAFAGKYSDPFYGSMNVELVEGKLRLTIGRDMTATLEHWQRDTFQAKWDKRWRGESFMSFQLHPVTGRVDSLTISGAVLRRDAGAQR
jgi:CubicO group peptidase (beta-lactamase class C family)